MAKETKAIMSSADKAPASKKKVTRRDPVKRRIQNREAQKVYREKQRKRIEDLERRAGALGGSVLPASIPENEQQMVLKTSKTPVDTGLDAGLQAIDPLCLQLSTKSPTREDGEIWEQDLMSANFDQWLLEDNQLSAYTNEESHNPIFYFNCGCPCVHIPMPRSNVLLPVIPDLHINNIGLDRWCVVGALIQNCLHVGMTMAMFCSDDAISPFFRLEADGPAEDSSIVGTVQRVFKTLHYDLRPTREQIVRSHHPFIDAIPFRDLRDNLIKQEMTDSDEDEFFHDALNHLTCWGGAVGAQAGGQPGSPLDSRSWEASEMFLHKWSHIVGGDDGELTRQSRWWKSIRGERITEVF
ncbi:hypothetical protein G7046_g325 [Stylonectria norvegica]|nr:hypothetical protein G7046_g325 [Stylonectria norvegica]